MLYKFKAIYANMRSWYVLTSLVLGMITLAVCFFYFYPTWRHIEETKGEILRLEESLKESRLSRGREVSLEGIRELEEDLIKMKAVIPGQMGLHDLFSRLEKLFLSHSFEKHTIEIGELYSCGDSSCDYFDIFITLSGPEGEIVDYIRSIEGYSRALDIRKVSLDRKEEDLFSCTLHVRAIVNYK